MSTPHPLYPFLQIRTSDGGITYKATQEYDFLAFLGLIRDRADIVAPVNRVVLDVEFDSAENSGAIEFMDDFGIGVDENGGVVRPGVSTSATRCRGRMGADEVQSFEPVQESIDVDEDDVSSW